MLSDSGSLGLQRWHLWKTLVTCWCWWLHVGYNFWVLVPDVYVIRSRMSVTKITKTVINISMLSPTHFVSNIRHQHRCRPPISNCVSIWKPAFVNWSCRSFWIKISSSLSSSPSLFPGHYLNLTSLIVTHQLWPTNYNYLTNYLSVINLLWTWIY